MIPTLPFDADLLRRYDCVGPRYTSYPTATQFGPKFNEAMLREHIARSNQDPIPRRLSLYMHVPYCVSPCFYCACNRVITRDHSKGDTYAARLMHEIEMAGALFDRDREVIQLHFGGGTPNFLDVRTFEAILGCIDQHFQLSAAPDRDFSIEIDPRTSTPEDIAAYAKLGFNRASFGVQDFDPGVQEAVNRIQSVEQTLAVVDACREHGFRSVNVDLIYGLPKQTLQGFARTLDIILAARPDRLAVYGYAHMPNAFKAQRQIKTEYLLQLDAKLALLQLAIDKLSAAGYRYIGMDHFALPEDELSRAQDTGALHRNFMGYTTHAQSDIIGLGASSISHIGDSYSQNAREIPAWEAAIDAGRLPVTRGRALDPDDCVRGDVIQQLMCHGRVDIGAVERRWHVEFPVYFADALNQMRGLVEDGLVRIEPQQIIATSRGRLLLRIIAMCFDRYRTENGPVTGSKVI